MRGRTKERDPIATAGDAANFLCANFRDAANERVIALHLCAARRPLGISKAEGCLSEAPLPVRLIVMDALRLDARHVIAAHNHPSGDPRPSEADISSTRRLATTLAELGITLDDHLIFAGEDCRSFRAMGLL